MLPTTTICKDSYQNRALIQQYIIQRKKNKTARCQIKYCNFDFVTNYSFIGQEKNHE